MSLLLTSSDVERAFPWDAAFESQRAAFTSISRGDAVMPDKVTLPSDQSGAWALCYTARLSLDGPVVAKLVSVAAGNAAKGLPMINGVVVLLDAETGRLDALVDGTSVTTIRTAAASAVAAAAIAPSKFHDLTILGSGVQALAHARALARTVRIERIRMFSPNPLHLAHAVGVLQQELWCEVSPAESAETALSGATLVAACTHSNKGPVLRGDLLEPGATVLSVGSYTPDRCEVDDDALRRMACFVVDHIPSASAHSGAVIRALQMGVARTEDLVEVGDVLLDGRRVRSNDDDIVFYNSVGVGAQDAAAAVSIARRARELGLGSEINLE